MRAPVYIGHDQRSVPGLITEIPPPGTYANLTGKRYRRTIRQAEFEWTHATLT